LLYYRVITLIKRERERGEGEGRDRELRLLTQELVQQIAEIVPKATEFYGGKWERWIHTYAYYTLSLELASILGLTVSNSDVYHMPPTSVLLNLEGKVAGSSDTNGILSSNF
jgi:hypothetical protein